MDSDTIWLAFFEPFFLLNQREKQRYGRITRNEDRYCFN